MYNECVETIKKGNQMKNQDALKELTGSFVEFFKLVILPQLIALSLVAISEVA